MRPSTAQTWLHAKMVRMGEVIIPYVVLSIIFGIISSCAPYVGNVMENWKLEGLERQIQSDMENQDYESAYLNTKELEPSASASSEKEEYWLKKKNQYQDKIIKLKRERDSADSSYIPAPESSAELEGRNYESVAGLFKDAGFTNIRFDVEYLTVKKKTGRTRPGHSGYTAVRVPDSYWFSWTRGSVTKVEFGCLSSFTTEDHCKADEEIVVHYHGDGKDPVSIPMTEPPEFEPPKLELPEIVFAVPDDQS